MKMRIEDNRAAGTVLIWQPTERRCGKPGSIRS